MCNHMGPLGYLDTGMFYNTEEFTLDYNEQHLLIIEVSSCMSYTQIFSSSPNPRLFCAGIDVQPERVDRLPGPAERPG